MFSRKSAKSVSVDLVELKSCYDELIHIFKNIKYIIQVYPITDLCTDQIPDRNVIYRLELLKEYIIPKHETWKGNDSTKSLVLLEVDATGKNILKN